MILNDEQIKLISENGGFIDASRGGLVIGRTHLDGGIYIVALTEKNEIKITAEMEGGEYLLSPEATQKHRGRLDEINTDITDCPELDPEIVKELNNLIIVPNSMAMIAITGAQYIINSKSTAKYLKELDDINRKT